MLLVRCDAGTTGSTSILDGCDAVTIFGHVRTFPQDQICVCVRVCVFFPSQGSFDEVLCGGFVPDIGFGVPHGDRGAGRPGPAL